MNVRLYVEGGGNSKTLKAACRRGFRKFIEEAGLAGSMPRIVACGNRQNAYESFKTGHEKGGSKAMLLVDAEGPISAVGPWQHLKDRDSWSRPDNATDDQCHLMVQIMESWFLADADALNSFYGQGFRRQSLPANPNVEDVLKRDVLDGFSQATAGTGKGSYHKGSHSFEILAKLDPVKVRKASAYADRFLVAL